MKPEIKFVGHASALVKHGSIGLLMDPWLTGLAFAGCWAPYSAPAAPDPDEVTHIWFSHEHPDHFSPASLRLFSDERRRKITVLYRSTRDRRVIDACKRMGFQTRELTTATTELSPETRVRCISRNDGDSMLYIQAGDTTILNLNDCVLNTPDRLRSILDHPGGDIPSRGIDVLMTQFGYANWFGSQEERLGAVDDKRRAIELQCKELRPKVILPFASFIYFCREDNWFMNDALARPVDVESSLGDISPRVWLYPGDAWRVGDDHDNAPSLARYRKDLETALGSTPLPAGQCSAQQILDAGAKWHAAVAGMIAPWIGGKIAPPVTFGARDLNVNFHLSLVDGVCTTTSPPDIVLNSDMLLAAIENIWGIGTLLVGATFESAGGASKLEKMNHITNWAKSGFRLPWSIPQIAIERARDEGGWGAIMRKVIRRYRRPSAS